MSSLACYSAALLLGSGLAIRGAAALPPAHQGQETSGTASWYGEAHRGKLMANGSPFDPDRLTAASWFYPLGTRLTVSLSAQPAKRVTVTVTDRGPAHHLVRRGRVIDLSLAAFRSIADPAKGILPVRVVSTEPRHQHLSAVRQSSRSP